jgi:hypothetical protein|tara:strand:+ start:5285 stop:5710 length:426 start_codon:yes stop_codon:yes gene_type:complete
MAVQILSRRSNVLFDRPYPTRLGVGELALNYNAGEPGLFFVDNTASPSTKLIKIGPIAIGATAPNNSAAGYTSLSKGESWLDTTTTPLFKIYDGSNWQIPKAVVSKSAGYPANPVDGMLHYNESIPALYIYNLATTAWVAV